jgi:hypothetical protein
MFVRELDFSAFGGILVTRTHHIREFQFPNEQNPKFYKISNSPGMSDLMDLQE